MRRYLKQKGFKNNKDAAKQLTGFESKLRKTGKILHKKITGLKKNIDDLDMKMDGSVAKRDLYVEEFKRKNERLSRINNKVQVRNHTGYPDYSDYYFHYSSFNIGFDYVSINKLFERGYPRIGLLSSARFWRDPYMYEDKQWRWGVHWLESAISVSITGADEQDAGLSNTPVLGDKDRALNLELSLFIPISKTEKHNDGSPLTYVGPILNYSWNFKEQDSAVQGEMKTLQKYYAGIRFAASPEWFAEAGVGKSEPLNSTRLFLRGQMPVYSIHKNNYVFLGGSANISLEPSKEVNENTDALKVYIIWNVNFTDIIGDK